MRIMIVTDAWHPQVNGVVRTMSRVKAAMEERGHEVHVVSPDGFRSFPCPGYPEIRLSLASASRLEAIADTIRPDAIHIVTEGPLGVAMRRVCLRRGWAFTSAFHTRFPEYVRARVPIPVGVTHTFIRRFHAPSSGVLVPTQSIIDDLAGRGYRNLKLWTRGVDRALFDPTKRGDLGLKRPVFLNVGRVATEKNLAAFLKLNLPGTKAIVGDGPQRAELEARFRDTVFLGARTGEDLARAFASADVFVFPSLTDTFGLVILEALASGLPVAAFPVPGPKDILAMAGPRSGALSDSLQEAALAALALGRVDPDVALKAFSWEACADIFEHTLIGCVSKEPVIAPPRAAAA